MTQAAIAWGASVVAAWAGSSGADDGTVDKVCDEVSAGANLDEGQKAEFKEIAKGGICLSRRK